MRPAALYDLLAGDDELVALGITPSRIKEHSGQDTRPFDSGYFIIIRFNEFSYNETVQRGPRNINVNVHTPWDRTRTYGKHEDILKRVTEIYRGAEQVTGQDGIVVSQIRKTGQSENMRDEGWETLTQSCTYHVLYG